MELVLVQHILPISIPIHQSFSPPNFALYSNREYSGNTVMFTSISIHITTIPTLNTKLLAIQV